MASIDDVASEVSDILNLLIGMIGTEQQRVPADFQHGTRLHQYTEDIDIKNIDDLHNRVKSLHTDISGILEGNM